MLIALVGTRRYVNRIGVNELGVMYVNRIGGTRRYVNRIGVN